MWNCSLRPVPLCYADYLRGGTIKGLTLEESLIFPLTSWKNLHGETVSGIELPQILQQKVWTQCGWGEPLETRVRSGSHCLYRPSKRLFTKHLLLHLHVNFLPPIWSPRPLPSTASFVFSRRWCVRWGLGPFWWAAFFSWVSPMDAYFWVFNLGSKLTQKDNAESGVQFTTPAGPRQGLPKDPD